MITKVGAGEIPGVIPQGVKNAFSGAGKVLGGMFTYGFPVYQYASGEESIGGAVGSMAGGSAGAFAGNTIGKSIGHSISAVGRTLRRAGGLKGKILGNVLNWAGKPLGTVGSLAGGLAGFEAGSSIGNKYMPIHKRNMDAPMPSPMLPTTMTPYVKHASLAPVVKASSGLSQNVAKYLFHGGGLAGAALAAYYGNKNFNEARAALARKRYLPGNKAIIYPRQFYANTQQ